MKLFEIINEMTNVDFTYDAAMDYANKIAPRGHGALVVRLKNKGDLDAFKVFTKDDFEKREDKEKYDIKHFVDRT